MGRFVIALVTTLLIVLLPLSSEIASSVPRYQQCSQVAITSPRPEAELRGVVTIEGSAAIGDFQFFKVEFCTAGQPDFWRAISDVVRTPVVNGVLDTWNTPAFPDGQYNLKLTTVDLRGQEVCRWIIRSLTIANSQPTSTPTAEALPTLPVPTATDTPQASPTPTTPMTPTPTPTIAAIIPTRQPTFPELETIQTTVSEAFDVQRLREQFMLGAGTTMAVFGFIGLIALLRRII